MAEFLVLPAAFIEYVANFKRLPVPPGTDLESLRSEIELVCLEASLEKDDQEARRYERDVS